MGFQNSATGPDLRSYAARSYSLMRPPRTGRRWIRFRERSATGWSGRGGRSWRLPWGRRPDHELADRDCRGRPSGTPSAGVVPFAGDQPPVPGEQRRRGHSEDLTPPAPGDQPEQCREPEPVARLVANPADLAVQHRVIVPQHQEFGIPGHLTPGQHHQATQQTALKQVDGREDHSGMIPARQAVQARSSNRASQGAQGQPRLLTVNPGRRDPAPHRRNR